jgi:hypothetical protein
LIALGAQDGFGFPMHSPIRCTSGMLATEEIRGIIHSCHFRISPLRNSDGRRYGKLSTIPQVKMNVS